VNSAQTASFPDHSIKLMVLRAAATHRRLVADKDCLFLDQPQRARQSPRL